MDRQSMAPAPDTAPSQDGGGLREKAEATADQARSSAATVADTAKEQAREVTGEAKAQAKSVAADVRDRLDQEARDQSGRAADMLTKWTDDLAQMAGDGDTPARAVARQLSDRGRELAEQLRGGSPNDLLEQVRRFARKRPGAFLAGSAAAGFIVGRLGKSLTSAAEPDSPASRPGPADDESTYRESTYRESTYGESTYGEAADGIGRMTGSAPVAPGPATSGPIPPSPVPPGPVPPGPVPPGPVAPGPVPPPPGPVPPPAGTTGPGFGTVPR